MKRIVNRKNNMFVIDKTQLKEGIHKEEVCNALYVELHTEFKGANENPDYMHKSNIEKLDLLNQFAYNWLQTRGFI